MIVCPNCRQPVEDGNTFCPMCGVSIPADAAPYVPPRTVRKKCANGHVWTDPDLTYCPDCGLELTESAELPTWACPHCGAGNTGDGPICIFCGKNRFEAARPVPPPMPRMSSDTLPSGLRPAITADLAKK